MLEKKKKKKKASSTLDVGTRFADSFFFWG